MALSLRPARANPAAGRGALLQEVELLLATAAREIRAHFNDGGRCAGCRSAVPCPRAELAEFAFGSLAPAGAPEDPGLPVHMYCWVFPGTADQVRQARSVVGAALGEHPIAEDVILCVSELEGEDAA